MEFIFNETIPKFWTQGYFNFGNQKRIATVTDVKFISENKLIVAHRAAAKLYLIELIDNNYIIKDTLLLKYDGSINLVVFIIFAFTVLVMSEMR